LATPEPVVGPVVRPEPSDGPNPGRPFRPSNVDDLREVYYGLYDERDAGEPIGITLFATRPSVEDEAAWFDQQARRAAAGEVIYLVAEVDGHAVGTCTIGRFGPTGASEQAHVGELGILVGRAMRGRGVGTALLGAALAEARSRFEVVYLTVFSVNERARRLYERFGFTVCGHLPRMAKRGDRYFDMERMVLVFPPGPPGRVANR